MASFAQLGNDLFTGKRSVAVVGRRNVWYGIAGILLVVSFLGIFGRGLNFGIEFTGGTELRVGGVSQMEDYESRSDEVVSEIAPSSGEVAATTIGTETIRIQTGEMTPEQANQSAAALAEEFGVPGDNVTSSLVGPSWGDTVTTKAIQALVVFLLLVTIVLAFYFRTLKMAVAALVALLHDVVFTVGIYALVGIEISPASMIGFLTILGYSIYDTIVVFDKVKENTEHAFDTKRQTYAEAANLAVNQTMIRSINTSVVALLPVAAILVVGIFFIGPGTLLDLSTALFIGIAVGTYSSIFIATPLLVHLRQNEEEIKDLDKKVARKRRLEPDPEPAVEADPEVEVDEVGAPLAANVAGTGADEEAGSPARAEGQPSTTGRQIHPMAQRGPRNQPRRAPRSRR
ncbi:protein translocase subunit SecF [Ornithinicoccus hortensis]|uniref:Protein-export membrane protein SecF n=1 Tax=Ornithinicoccus hortensis TaxID=82346 RepID=A0A542YTA3_9MICO|nr:protein translocase subunit SecF [Ornithinicoccus hortensis]TQL51308.1 protein translocase subunit secF [Ornithinicoccus hortensis]